MSKSGRRGNPQHNIHRGSRHIKFVPPVLIIAHAFIPKRNSGLGSTGGLFRSFPGSMLFFARGGSRNGFWCSPPPFRGLARGVRAGPTPPSRGVQQAGGEWKQEISRLAMDGSAKSFIRCLALELCMLLFGWPPDPLAPPRETDSAVPLPLSEGRKVVLLLGPPLTKKTIDPVGKE